MWSLGSARSSNASSLAGGCTSARSAVLLRKNVASVAIVFFQSSPFPVSSDHLHRAKFRTARRLIHPHFFLARHQRLLRQHARQAVLNQPPKTFLDLAVLQ